MTAHTEIRPRGGHESSGIPLKPLLWFVAGFIATAVVIHSALAGYASLLGAQHKHFGRVYQLQPTQVPAYPAPALQVNPRIDLQTYRTRADHDLNSYGWIDQGQGVAKIPIERAMDLLLARGLPVRPAVQDGPTELNMQEQKAAADSAGAAEQPPGRRRP
ncbi:MAG: hypothetical protein JO015_14270 [Verrucomicrobia bacterium]|nr:hypothetical protein [Verrucomicrobiota bacterium]